MLHLIPAPLHRLAYRLAHALRKRWWRIARPRVTGCRMLAFDAEGRVLLVRHSYGSGKWMAPSGGMKPGEDPCDAARHELREEVNCTIDPMREIARVEEPLSGATNVVHIVAGPIQGTPKPNMREIVEARFFAPDALPQDMPAPLRAALPAWIRAATAADRPPPAPHPAHPPAQTG